VTVVPVEEAMSEPEETRPAPSHLAVLVAIALGGALGAPARYGIAQLVPFTPGTFPWGTFWTNISGAFVLGLFLTFVIERFPPTRFVRPFFGIGFLGAYTTFSTLAVETARLVKDGHVALGVGYTLVSIATGLLVAALGIVAARALPGRRVRVPTLDEELEG
jgi:CrcB protein